MSGQLAAAGWARRGHVALPLEVSVGDRTRARLQRGRPAFRLRSLHGPRRCRDCFPGQKPTGFCDDLCRSFCSHRAALRAAKMDGLWEGGGGEGVIWRSEFESRVVM